MIRASLSFVASASSSSSSSSLSSSARLVVRTASSSSSLSSSVVVGGEGGGVGGRRFRRRRRGENNLFFLPPPPPPRFVIGRVAEGRRSVATFSSESSPPPPSGVSSSSGNSRFGPLGHDYKLYPRAGPKTSPLSDERIHDMLSRRLEARLARKFGLADEMRTELQSLGVDVDDKSRLWRADGKRFGEKAERRRPSRGAEEAAAGGESGRRGRNDDGGGGRGGGENRQTGRFGPLGHNYRLYRRAGPKTSTLPDDRIHELLSRRLEAKLTRKFRSADSIRDELHWHGVDVDDSSKLWRADGRRFGEDEAHRRGRGGERRKLFGPLGHDYEPSPAAGPNCSTLSEDRIHELLSRRLEAKLGGKFDEADEMRNELNRNGVEVDDERRLWRADGKRFGEEDEAADSGSAGRTSSGGGGGGGGEGVEESASSTRRWDERGERRERRERRLGHDYALCPTAGPNASTLSDDRIREVLSRRLEAFSVADGVRDRLRRCGVDVDDERRLWRADGKTFKEDEEEEGATTADSEGGGRATSGGGGGGRSGRGANGSASTTTTGSRDDDRDGPRERRREAGTSRPGGGRGYALCPTAGPNASTLSENRIHEMLSRRLEARRTKKFDAADEIRRELNRHGVEVDDGGRLWRADGSRFGEDGTRGRATTMTSAGEGEGGGATMTTASRTGGSSLLDRFGPHGHDYRPYPLSGPKTSTLSDDRIHSLLSRRLRARLSRKYDDADRIRGELHWYGVDVDDDGRVWRADGRRFADDDGYWRERRAREEWSATMSSSSTSTTTTQHPRRGDDAAGDGDATTSAGPIRREGALRASTSSSSSPKDSMIASEDSMIASEDDTIEREEELRRRSRRRREGAGESPRTVVVVVDLATGKRRMAELLDLRISLPPPPTSWMGHGGTDETQRVDDVDDFDGEAPEVVRRREALFEDAVELVERVKELLDSGRIRASGNAVHALSDLLGNALLLCSESPPPRPPPSRRNDDDGATTEAEDGRGAVDDDDDRRLASSPASPSPFDVCLSILDVLYRQNMDMIPSNYDCAIRAACHERRWEEASALFASQIDPDASGAGGGGGMVPVEPGSAEVGLYAIARAATAAATTTGGDDGPGGGFEGSSGGSVNIDVVVERVFDAVTSMTMVSPADEERYILAAGSALGRAGEWKGLLDRRRTSLGEERSAMGGSEAARRAALSVAAMEACVLCSRHDEALELYRSVDADPDAVRGREWQWSGGSHSIVHPLCRDLALRAMGGSRGGGRGAEALELFERIVEDGGTIGVDAVRSTLRACERDGDWKSAVHVLQRIMDVADDDEEGGDGAGWTIADDGRGGVEDRSGESSPSTGKALLLAKWKRALNGDAVASIMGACNASGEFGLAMLYSQLASLFHIRGNDGASSSLREEEAEKGLVEALLTSKPSVIESDPLLASTMVSLCGLDCHEHAVRLYDAATTTTASGRNGGGSHRADDKDDDRPDAAECRAYASSRMATLDRVALERPWEVAHRHLRRLTAIADVLTEEGKARSGASSPSVSLRDAKLLARAVAKAMNCCIEAGQPGVALLVGRRVGESLRRRRPPPRTDDPSSSSSRSASDAVRSFFGFDRPSKGEGQREGEAYDDDVENDGQRTPESDPSSPMSKIDFGYLSSTDGLLAATMRAHRASGNDGHAIELFFSKMEEEDNVRTIENFFSKMEEEDNTGEDEDERTESSSSAQGTAEEKEDDNALSPHSIAWSRSVDEALTCLVCEGHVQDAESLFREHDITARTPATFLTMARAYASEERWESVDELYHDAVRSGALTEALAFLAMECVARSPPAEGKMRSLRSIVDDASVLFKMKPQEWAKSRYWTVKHLLGPRYARLLMWWNDPREARVEEHRLAMEQFEDGRVRGIVAKNQVLKYLVTNAGRDYRSQGGEYGTSVDAVPDPPADAEGREEERRRIARSKGVSLVVRCLLEARKTSLWENPSFLDRAATALVDLGGNIECVELVRDAISRGVRVRPTTVQRAISAAEEEGDASAADEFGLVWRSIKHEAPG